MNLEKIFDFINEKRGYEYPFNYRLINGYPLDDDELVVYSYLDLKNSKIESLPDNFTVCGTLYLENTNITGKIWV